MATKKECKVCIYRKKKDCPILQIEDKVGRKFFMEKCISYKDK